MKNMGYWFITRYQYNKLLKYLEKHYKKKDIDYWDVEEHMNPLNSHDNSIISIDLIEKLCKLWKNKQINEMKKFIY